VNLVKTTQHEHSRTFTPKLGFLSSSMNLLSLKQYIHNNGFKRNEQLHLSDSYKKCFPFFYPNASTSCRNFFVQVLKNYQHMHCPSVLHVLLIGYSGFWVINTLSPNINVHIFLTVLLIFLMVLVGRIWLKIKTFDRWWSFPLFS